MNTLSVSALNEQIKTLLETSFNQVLVEGELSRITFHNSGHIYFTLKDSSSAVSCVMFRGNASRLKFQLEEGLKVVINGAISLYKPRGSYQINCFSIEPSGSGALALAYQQLKEKLSKQGYFDEVKKKVLPKYPSKIAIITSLTSAALQDMLRVIQHRYKLLEVDIYDVLVQGENASSEISQTINNVDKKSIYDIIVIGRGGGSIEDLWAFNEEIVADAIFNAKTPIVSAVGHEIDYLISDFVSDLRAPTPSAAMEMILPDTSELLLYIDSLSDRFSQIVLQKISINSQNLKHLQNSFSQHSVERKLNLKKDEISQIKESFYQVFSFKIQRFQNNLDMIKNRYPQVIDSKLTTSKNKLDNLKNMLESNNPKYKTKKGFAQLSDGKKVIDISTLNVDDTFEVQSDKTIINAKVINKRSI